MSPAQAAPGVPDQAGSGTPDQAELGTLAVEAAQAGAELLLERFMHGERRDVRSKSTPTDLVSEADLASQRAIRALLEHRRPQDSFLGEEGGPGEGGPGERDARERGCDVDEQVRGGLSRMPATDDTGGGTHEVMAPGDLRWIVDPLDGTVNFLFGIPQWCVSVAVQDHAGRMLAGAIVDPCRQEIWTATAGAQAALNGRAIAGSKRGELASAMVATGLYYDAAVRAQQGLVLARLAPLVRDIRRFGSAALDLAWTAAGRYDAYFERGVKLWDVAAGELMCRRAGLALVSLEQRGVLPAGVLVAPEALVGPLMELVG